MIRPIQAIGGFLYALPFIATEWYLLAADGPWWVPHPADGPAPSAWLATLGVLSLLTLLMTHATALLIPPTETWDDFWKTYLGMMQLIGGLGMFAFLVVVQWYFMRQVTAVAIPLATFSFHATAMMKARR